MQHNLEKDLKRWLKRKISVSLAVMVVFAITGSIGFAQNATLEGENKFTGNNTFEGKNQNSTFTVEVKGKATDPKDKNKTIEDQESTVKHTLTAVGSYTRADGKKKIHNAIMQRGKLESMDEKDQIVFHTLDDTGSHLVARGAKKINGSNGQDSSITIHSKIFDENNKEIASQTLKHDGIHTVVREKDSVIANQVKNSIYSHMTGKGMDTVGEKDKFIRQEVKESVVTRLSNEGSSIVVEKGKKIFNQVKDSVQFELNEKGSYTTAQEGKNIVSKVNNSVQHRLTKDGSNISAEEGKSIASEVTKGAVHKLSNEGVFTKAYKGKKIINEVEGGAKLVMDETASKFTKDLYVGNNVWKDTSAIGNQLVIGNQSNEAKKKDSIAIGFDNSVISEGALALGKNNVISGQGSVIIGDSNDVSGKKSLALGASNSVLRKRSLAVGSDNLVDAEESGVFGIGETTVNSNGTVTHKYRNEGKGSYAFGNFNSIAKGTENNFILGNKVKIEEGINNSVVLGNESTARKATTEKEGKVGDIQFGNFAGQGKPENGVVSVGAEGKERQIINVAAGKVSQDSTDAVNGSQLFSAVQKLTDTGLNFQGNDEQEVQRKLGQTLTLRGEGVSKEQSAKFEGASGNINVKKSKEDGSLELQLAKDLQNIDSISNGSTKITFTKSPLLGKPIIDVHNARIQNVAAGVYNTDAVNVGQLKKSEGTLTNLGLNFMGNTLMPVHRDLGQTLIIKGEGVNPIQAPFFKSASGNINVHALGSLLFGNYGLEIQLAKDLQNIESISNKKTKIALLKDSIAMNQALHMGDSNTQHQIKYVADGTDLTDAVNLKQLKEYNTELEKKGLNFAGNDGKVIHKNLGEKLEIVGSLGDGEDASSQNLRTRKTDDGKLELLLAQNLKLNSVTTGNTIINNFGVTIQEGDKKVTLSKDGLDNGGNKIVNVAEGTEKTDAVNKGQLDKAVAAATTEVTAGKNIDVTVATGDNGQKVYQVGLKDKITLGTGEKAVEIDGEQGTLKVGNKITMDGKTGNATFGKVAIHGEQGTVNGLTNITWDPNNYTSGQAATEDQLKVVDKKVEDLGTTIGKGYTFAGDTGSVNKKLGDTVKITGDGKNITTSVTESGDLKVELNKKIEVEQITSEKMILKNSDGSTTDVGETLKEHSEKIEENAQSIKKGLNFAGNHGTTNKQLGDTMSIKGKDGISEEDIKTKYDTENVVTTVDKDGNLWIKLSKNPKFNSVEAGEGDTKVTIGNDGVKIGDKTYITKDGLDANNQKIVNVADGTIAKDSKDAVNGGQIHNIVQDINNSIHQTNHRIDKLDDKVNRGLANAAAMAGIEFMDIGINQGTVAAAVGGYKGTNAVAVGVQGAPTENTRVNAKVSVAPGTHTEMMYSVGAAYRFNWK
ncbi:YadA-like family protein [Fusobacterium necrophorum subsp. funduliforme]